MNYFVEISYKLDIRLIYDIYIYMKNSIYLRIIIHESIYVDKFSITYGLLLTDLYL